MYSVGEGEFVDFIRLLMNMVLVAETGFRSEKAYLLNKIGDVICEKSCSSCTVQKKVIMQLYIFKILWVKQKYIRWMLIGNMNQVDNYCKMISEFMMERNLKGLVDYILGTDDNIYIKRTNDKFYKLINKMGNNLAYDKY